MIIRVEIYFFIFIYLLALNIELQV
jgi:hypothetical protein